MAITKAKKSEILSMLVENIKNAKSIWFTKTNWLTVADFSDLRNNLRTVNTTYNLTKKTLIKIAIKEALNLELNLEELPGQIWIICSNDDAITWLSKTNEFINKKFDKKAENQKISWVASIFEWEFRWFEDTKTIASIPSRETLLTRLLWSMQSPVSGLARFFDAYGKKLSQE